MAKRSLFDRIEIPPENIYRIRGEDPPESAAASYEKKLRLLADAAHVKVLSHDLLLLGVGEDGHTASLFPGTAALSERNRLVVPNFVPKQNSWRITFTYPLINDSRHICFLVNHKKKQSMIDKILKGDRSYPASHVTASESVAWLLGF
jgi:6-phosphogluconolactonase